VSVIAATLAAAEAVSDKKDIYPKASELIVGAIAFAILFVFMAKWVLPRLNTVLEERRTKIQGALEDAESARREASAELDRYRAQLADARTEANRIIEEARQTADQLRMDLQRKAEQQGEAIVERAQEEIRAERDRVFQELRGQIGDVAVELAERVVGKSLDRGTHEKLIDDFIQDVAAQGNGRSGGGQG
jgi:F-type H+-transporting ATPase subunit b